MIFTMLLKSYLFCYTLVSACAKVLFCKTDIIQAGYGS
jgi:hypothetical protein